MDKQAVEHHDIGGHLRSRLVAPGVVGALRRGNQQAQEKRAHCRDERDCQLYDIFCVCAQMVLGKRGPQNTPSSAPPNTQTNTMPPMAMGLTE